MENDDSTDKIVAKFIHTVLFYIQKFVEIRRQVNIFFIYPSSMTLCLLRWLSSLLQIPMTITLFSFCGKKNTDRHACLSVCVKMRENVYFGSVEYPLFKY